MKLAKIFDTLSRTILLPVLALAFAGPVAVGAEGSGAGNGGDPIRATFLQRGQEVLHFLKTNKAGKFLVDEYDLNLGRLRVTLSTTSIQVVHGPLYDNTGSLVDSVGTPGKLLLDQQRWDRLLDQNQNLHYMVFHEMLRSAGYNDDDYRISGSLMGKKISVAEQASYKHCLVTAELVDREDFSGYHDSKKAFMKAGLLFSFTQFSDLGHELILTKRNGETLRLWVNLKAAEFGATAGVLYAVDNYRLQLFGLDENPNHCVKAKDVFKTFYGTGAGGALALAIGMDVELAAYSNGRGFHWFIGPSILIGGIGAHANAFPLKTIRIRPSGGFGGLSLAEREFLGIDSIEDELWGPSF